MNESDVRAVVRAYYEAWAARDLKAARNLLDDDLDFRSAVDRFASADEFIGKCADLSDELGGVEFLREVYSEDQAFVVLGWSSESEPEGFVTAEYLRIRDGRITEVLVVTWAPEFATLVR